MSEALGPVSLDHGDQQHFLGRDIGLERQYGEDTAEIVDAEVAKLVKGAYERAKSLLSENLDKLHALARRLIEKETVDRDELQAILQPA
jgi:cell division protease FtsH